MDQYPQFKCAIHSEDFCQGCDAERKAALRGLSLERSHRERLEKALKIADRFVDEYLEDTSDESYEQGISYEGPRLVSKEIKEALGHAGTSQKGE